jgi:tetratricopeptide (TPR) repeat protein
MKPWAIMVEAEKHYKSSLKRFKKNQYIEAVEEIRKSLKVDPDLGKAYLLQAQIYEKMGDLTSAAESYEGYLKCVPDSKASLDFLVLHYTKEEKLAQAGYALQRRAAIEKKKEIRKDMLTLAAKIYLEGKDYEKSRQVYHMLLEEDSYNPEIFEKLKTVYHRQGIRRKWKACREVLMLNKQITGEISTESIGIFKVDRPLTPDLFETLIHPGERTFRKYFSWLKPLFKILEQPTPEEILKLTEPVEDEEIFTLYRECCQFLNMDPPQLLKYNGSARFKFMADPADKNNKYRLIYNKEFVKGLSQQELVFLFLTQLVLIKGDFVPLLNLSLSDVAKVLLEVVSFIFGILSFLEAAPLGKVANFVGKLVVSKKILDKVMDLHKKISKFKPLGKSPGEIQSIINSSVEMMPEKIIDENEIDRKSFLNQKFLESALTSIYLTADRVAYYFTRDLVTSTKALIKLTDTKEALARVERFGLQHYLAETKNQLLKNRLGELFFFSVDGDFPGEEEKDRED